MALTELLHRKNIGINYGNNNNNINNGSNNYNSSSTSSNINHDNDGSSGIGGRGIDVEMGAKSDNNGGGNWLDRKSKVDALLGLVSQLQQIKNQNI